MIDSKLLGVIPLNLLKPDSDEFFIALACRLDAGDDFADLGDECGKNAQTIAKLAEKGRKIRDRLIREGSERMIKAVQMGEVPPPKVVQLVVTRVTFNSPPRGLYVPNASAMVH
jgi:hypothetical protein